jgi:hypothetical protein
MGAPLHLARVGSYRDMHGQDVAVTPEILRDLAESYDPTIYRAPLVIGHPKDNSPAFGFLDRPALKGGTDLEAHPIRVDAALAEAARAGRYSQGSLSFWWPQTPGNPRPGRHYIRHFGLLGAAAPAIPGLRGADLAADPGGPALIALDTEPAALAAALDSVVSAPAQQDNKTLDAEFARIKARELEISARERAVTEREEFLAWAKELAERERAVAERERAIRAQQPAAELASTPDVRQVTGGGATDRLIADRAIVYRAKMAAAGINITLSDAMDAAEGGYDH